MSFTQKLSAGVKKHMANLKEMHDQRVQAAEDRARRQLAAAQTKTEREKVKLQLRRDLMAAKKELYEAQTAARQAKTALEKARKEAGDLTMGERLGQVGRGVGKSSMLAYKALVSKPPRRKRVVRKKTRR